MAAKRKVRRVEYVCPECTSRWWVQEVQVDSHVPEEYDLEHERDSWCPRCGAALDPIFPALERA